MKQSQSSGFGIIVDKSKATKTFPMNITPFPRGCRLNHETPTPIKEEEDPIGKIAAIAMFVLYLLLLCL